ncbi:hypothetical protein GSI_12181 [Ganoderma sinense ZZ0214-1]|uniref:Uncharacterized protein n=1 Tax=Ganoderma sinense ZZ0214-1 TaxID=1077348 RepID=A0A2G8RY56_9APHY|nr:hypothetical protein GSI_12181 [Ganoderma sinense ZZ0214-1]
MPLSNDAAEISLGLLTTSLEDTIGAVLVATFCALLLYGISLNQLYRYLLQFPSDDRYVQAICTQGRAARIILNGQCDDDPMAPSYFAVVSNLTQKEALLNHAPWSENAVLIASAPILIVCQMFFARRIWIIGPRYRLIIGIGAVVLLTEFGFAIAISYKSFMTVLSNDTGGVRWLITAGLSTAFAADLLFTPTLTVALWLSRRGRQGKQGVAELFSTYIVNTVLANSLLSALNSRDPQKSPSIFDSGSYGRNLIQRMNHRAAAETWNVPQIPDEPSVIHINVMTENEGVMRDSQFKRGFATA